MVFYRRQGAGDIGGVNSAMLQSGDEMMSQNMVSAFDIFTRIQRLVAGNTLSPAFGLRTDDAYQQNIPSSFRPK